mmetsp:Transcript_7357/g.13844  ORF Transcript_7357/g.13844 Transcript_7357/m.13844 type:complete len:289 (-) Transcript_7357:58-924(-)
MPPSAHALCDHSLLESKHSGCVQPVDIVLMPDLPPPGPAKSVERALLRHQRAVPPTTSYLQHFAFRRRIVRQRHLCGHAPMCAIAQPQVPVGPPSPSEHLPLVCDRHGVLGAARQVRHLHLRKRGHGRRNVHVVRVVQPQLAELVASKRQEALGGEYGEAVVVAAGDAHKRHLVQRGHHHGHVDVHVVAVAQPPEVALAPGEDLHGGVRHRHGVLRARGNGGDDGAVRERHRCGHCALVVAALPELAVLPLAPGEHGGRALLAVYNDRSCMRRSARHLNSPHRISHRV